MNEEKLLEILNIKVAEMWKHNAKDGLRKALSIEHFLNLYKSQYPLLTKKYFKECSEYKNYIRELTSEN